jgi:4-amino-4-deoxy-L-arabinose transferase-like glycosyltransferase
VNSSSPITAPPTISWQVALLVFLAVLLLSIPQAALLPLLDRDEPRFAEASREMLQSGNFIVPTFNGAPRYAKPPLIYWCQAISYTIFGENAFAARLPSLLATAATAALLYVWGAQLAGEQVGLGAALAYAFCLQTVQQGRVATADALLIFFMTLTAYAGWKLLGLGRRYYNQYDPPASFHRTRIRWAMILAFGFAGGFLAKGPEALLPFLPLIFCARGIRSGLSLRLMISFFTGLILILFWAIPAYVMTHGDYWRVGLSEGIGERMVSGLQGHGASTLGWYLLSLPYYLLLFWLSALPWSPLLIARGRKLFATWTPDAVDTYLLLNAGQIFLIFTFMVTKLPHYTLPAFPFLALILAQRWHAAELPPGTLTKLGWTTGIVFALLAAFLVPEMVSNHASPSPVGVLVQEAGNALTPETEFALVDFQEPNAIWEMRRVSKSYGQFIAEADIASFLNQPGPHAVILSTSLWEKMRGSANYPWQVFYAQGWNTAKAWDSSKHTWAFVDLTLVVKP